MKNFLCTKDCIEACFTNVDDNLNILPENRKNSGRYVCSKLLKFLKKEIFSSDKSFISVNGIKSICNTEDIILSAANSIKQLKRILYIRGSGSLGYMMNYWDLLFSHFQNIFFVNGSLCLSTGSSAHQEDFGVKTNPPIENLEQVDNIILFGRDAYNVSPHLYTYLKKLKKSGKRIIYIDPIYRKTAQIADIYIRINPASDNFLCAAILENLGKENINIELSVLLEKSGVSKDHLEYLTKIFRQGKTALITGYGLQRYINGKNIVQWINRLAYFTDNLNYLYYVRNSKEGLPEIDIPNNKINISEILKFLEDDFFDGAIIVAANPLISFPSSEKLRRSFEKLKFLMVVDTNITETAQISTHFIKVGGMFAQEDISGSYFYNDRLNKRDKIFNLLSDANVIQKFVKNFNIYLNIKLPEKPSQISSYTPRKYLTKKLELIENRPNGLRLITGSHYSYLNSQRFGDFKENFVYISQQDAIKFGIKDGDVVNLSNENGKISGIVKISDLCGDGYIFCYKCQFLKDGHPNILSYFTPTDSNTGIALYDTFVNIV